MIFCDIDGIDYGVTMIMTIHETYGLTGTFFVETEQRHYFGDDILDAVVRPIVSRGHEAQLHLHPGFRAFLPEATAKQETISDSLRSFSEGEQRQMLAEAKAKLERAAGHPITAFRAGSYQANRATLRAAAAAGLVFASNYNLRYGRLCEYVRELPETNDWFELEGIIEFPVTGFHQPPRKEPGMLQLNGASFDEM
jgi:peptidoglycan/xylan/chitin deacetylase (PgdA/CDA1 family)